MSTKRPRLRSVHGRLARKYTRVFVYAGLEAGRTIHLEKVCENRERAADDLLELIKVVEKWGRSDESCTSAIPVVLNADNFLCASFQGLLADQDYLDANEEDPLMEEEVHPPKDIVKEALRTMSKEEREYMTTQPRRRQEHFVTRQHDLLSAAHVETCPLRFRVIDSKLPDMIKCQIIEKLERQREGPPASDMHKYRNWVEALLSLPLDVFSMPSGVDDGVRAAIALAEERLDSVVYGHRRAKQALLERYFQWLTHPMLPQRPLGLMGPPGNGKTTLIQQGLALVMNRAFTMVPLGGSCDSSFLLGHSYTYEGSTPGRIASILISSRSMNPFIFFDELDKCSQTPKGDEVANCLVHLTDTSQNDVFHDRYLHGVTLDVSRCLLFFSFNDPSKIAPVLLDRLQVVEMESFDEAAQRQILTRYLMPSILNGRGLPEERVSLSTEAVSEFLGVFRANEGLRLLRSALEEVVNKVLLFEATGDGRRLYPMRDEHVRIEASSCVILSGAAESLISPCAANGSTWKNMYC